MARRRTYLMTIIDSNNSVTLQLETARTRVRNEFKLTSAVAKSLKHLMTEMDLAGAE